MKVGAKRTPYSRNSTMEHMEKMLSTWIEDQNQCHVPVSMLLVQTKAYENLSMGDDNVKSRSANTGWFSRFTKRYNFNSIKITGEAASADYMAVKSGCQSPNPRNTQFQMGILCLICVTSSRMQPWHKKRPVCLWIIPLKWCCKEDSVASTKESDADRMYLRYCPARVWTWLRCLEGARDRRWLRSETSTHFH